MSQRRWADLDPDPAMLVALDRADTAVDRAQAVAGSRELRSKWSNKFADGCAVMVADEVRAHHVFRNLIVRPEAAGPGEPLTFVAGGKDKKVDVIASSLVSGLQVGFSLKGMNFRDTSGLQFDKNLTGRTYELQDEVSVIHRYQPAAFIVAVYFMPIASTEDKKSEKSPSSFARAVGHLRARTGRLHPMMPSHMDRLDMAAVALYVPGDNEALGAFSYEDSLPRGVVRFFDVNDDPPMRGRPRIETTLSLAQLVDRVAGHRASVEDLIEWADPE